MMGNVHERMKQIYLILAEDDRLPILLRLPVLLASAIVFQSLVYMEAAERWYKIVQNTAFGIIALKLNEGMSVPVAIVVGHLSGFFLNGQLPGVLKNVGLLETPPERFARWIRLIELCGERAEAISAVGIYGSLSRNELSQESDLDVRIVRRGGIRNAVESCVISNGLRLAATVTLFPIDIYVVYSSASLDKLRDDEDVQVLVDKDRVFYDQSNCRI
jgi:hypothetical protein